MGLEHIRLVVSDLDGTLLRSDRTTSARTRAAVAGLAASGVTFAIATGRAPRHLAGLGIDETFGAIVVCGNGSIIVDLATDTVVERTIIEPTVGVAIVADVEREVPGCVFAAEIGPDWCRDPRFRSVETIPPTHSEPGAVSAARGAIKLLLQHPERAASDLFDLVCRVIGDRASVTRSTDRFIELGPPGVDKGSGVRHLRERLGLAQDEVLAVGDMLNDLPMFEAAGWRVAVANAHPDVLAVADQVTASNEEDGVALVLEHVVAERGGP